jgi:hypothetical protein
MSIDPPKGSAGAMVSAAPMERKILRAGEILPRIRNKNVVRK